MIHIAPPRNTATYAKWLDNNIRQGKCPHCGMVIRRGWNHYIRHRMAKHMKLTYQEELKC